MLERLIKRLSWEPGRIGTGYNKILLLQSGLLKFDIYLLYYPEGSEITPHVDIVCGKSHYRLNVMLKKAERGGEFVCENPIFRGFRMNLFRPDSSVHSVTKVEKGYRVMLSIGWVRG